VRPYLQNRTSKLRAFFCACYPWPWPRPRCSRSCTSGLVDDVTLSHNGPNGAGDASGCSSKWLTRGNTDFTSQRILKLTRQGAAQDRAGVWCLRRPMFCLTTSFVNEQCKRRTIVRCEHVINGVTKISNVSKIAIATNIKPLLTHKTLTRVFTHPLKLLFTVNTIRDAILMSRLNLPHGNDN